MMVLPPGRRRTDGSTRLGSKAAKMGHDPEGDALNLVRQHLAELEAGMAKNQVEGEESQARLEKDLGDVLFSLCQAARRLGLDAEESLRASNRRFVGRFKVERDAN